MKSAKEAIIALSPGNSYFTFPVLSALVEKAVATYHHVTAFVPDIPAIDTYLALGYSQKRAREKAITKGGNHLKSKLRRAMRAQNISEDRLYILEWERDIAPDARYQQARRQVGDLYECAPAFQQAVRAATQEVLESKKVAPQQIEINTATDQGVKYLLAELAFLEAAEEILNTPKADVIYHRPWPVFEKLINGEYDGKKRPNLGFRQGF